MHHVDSAYGLIPFFPNVLQKTGLATHCLIFHASKDDVEHLCQGCLGGCLINQVLTGQVDVVTGAHS